MSTLSILGIVFIVLKLAGVITWSWWIVCIPFYLMFLIPAFTVFGILIFRRR